MSPQRNSGIDKSRIEQRSASGSNKVPRRWNKSRPPPRPKMAASAIALTASSLVAGKVAATSDPAWRPNCMERPKSPCSAAASQIMYCSGSGRSSPISRRLASISAIVAVGGSDIAAGSIGSRRSTQNNSAETTSRIGMAASRRRAMSLATVVSIALRLPHQGAAVWRISSTVASAAAPSHCRIWCSPDFSYAPQSRRFAATASSPRFPRRSVPARGSRQCARRSRRR